MLYKYILRYIIYRYYIIYGIHIRRSIARRLPELCGAVSRLPPKWGRQGGFMCFCDFPNTCMCCCMIDLICSQLALYLFPPKKTEPELIIIIIIIISGKNVMMEVKTSELSAECRCRTMFAALPCTANFFHHRIHTGINPVCHTAWMWSLRPFDPEWKNIRCEPTILVLVPE